MSKYILPKKSYYNYLDGIDNFTNCPIYTLKNGLNIGICYIVGNLKALKSIV